MRWSGCSLVDLAVWNSVRCVADVLLFLSQASALHFICSGIVHLSHVVSELQVGVCAFSLVSIGRVVEQRAGIAGECVCGCLLCHGSAVEPTSAET